MFPSVFAKPISLTVFGRSLLLISLEVAANAICWAFAARSHAILGLAILAWVHVIIEVRTALDADHISAIDNATRTLINHGRLAITCGLFFSLGHSTINVAIVISTSIYNKLNGVGNVGSIVGTAISGSFLFIVGLANSIILCKILRQRRQARRKRHSEHGGADPEVAPNQNMLMMRLLGPLVNFVNRPWKMYPVGVLFGLGFDTASSVALLAISALANDSGTNTRIPPSDVIILPLLFTTGMTLVDSVDSVLMLYSYTGFAGHSWRIFEPSSSPSRTTDARSVNTHGEVSPATANEVAPADQPCNGIENESRTVDNAAHDSDSDAARREHSDRMVMVKRSTMSELSITLTTMSILLAFSISLIEIMGLIGGNCGRCQAAASAPDGGGLAGMWWRGWAQANDNSGYIGAAIVGTFIVIVGGWYMRRFCMRF
ncbi:NicO-domain-containing protein [Boletus coccyginus]|nr:NicO-domain-containing protein [Boletus coccyginus]